MQRLLLFLLILFFSVSLRSQTGIISDDSLTVWAASFLDINVDDSQKMADNARFVQRMEELLRESNSMEIPFTDLKNISVMTAPDGSFRLFTWLVLTRNGYQPQGVLQVKQKKKTSFKIYPLNHTDADQKSVKYRTLSPDKWYGAVYYEMIPIRFKGDSYYVLIGFNGNDGLSHKKVLDVLSFSGTSPRFGLAVFEEEQKAANRVVFEYSARVKMSLRYDANKKEIIFDHLAPVNPSLVGHYKQYGPDMSYDAFVYRQGKWVYKPDVDARNDSENLGKPGTFWSLPGDTLSPLPDQH